MALPACAVPGQGVTPAGSGVATGPALGGFGVRLGLGARLAADVGPAIGPLADGSVVDPQPVSAVSNTLASTSAPRGRATRLVGFTAAL
jgi:hypothetical protein